MPSFAATIDLSTLDGTNGFTMSGGAADDNAGRRVAYVGDLNGDGFGDFVVGAFGADLAGANFGAAYVIFGGAGGFPANLDLASLNPSEGLTITGSGGAFGLAVGGGMDLNNDGRPDLVIGAPVLGPVQTGGAYVLFGQSAGLPASPFAISGLNGTNGVTLTGQIITSAGWEVASIGDVNGDGIDDLGLCGRFSDTTTAFVLFGRDGGFGPTLSLNGLDGTDGFKLTGIGAGSTWGVSIDGGSDINGDGIDDLIVGGCYGDVGGTNFGGAYVVFGRDTAVQGDFAGSLAVVALDGSNGFSIAGFQSNMNVGYSVAAIGDLNGDGFDDMAIGARRADISGGDSGAVFVVFGKDTAVTGDFAAILDPNSLDGSNGFWLVGEKAGDVAGSGVAAAGDVNGDGLADLLIGAVTAEGPELSSGAAYVLFGRTDGFSARINLSNLDGTTGVRIYGQDFAEFLGAALSAGDINGDGLSDIILGAYNAEPNGAESGRAYVIYGIQADLTLTGTAADEAINGKIGDDTIHGLSGRDTLSGLGGDDVIEGGDMGDLLYGGDGADDLLGGAGGDVLNGDAGDDGLSGGDNGDKLFGGSGVDTLLGGAGLDRLDGGDGADVLNGGADNDLLDGGAGADAMTGGAGNDIFLIDDAGDTALEAAGEGFDIIRTALDGWVLGANFEGLELQGVADIDGTGNSGANNLQGNGGANRLDGGAGVDTLNGADGDDIVIGGLGNDLMRGGLGVDVFVVAHVATGTIETDQIYDFSTAEGDSLDLSGAYGGTLGLVAAFTKSAGEMTLTFAGGVTTLRLDTTGDGKVDYQMKINGDVTADSGDWAL